MLIDDRGIKDYNRRIIPVGEKAVSRVIIPAQNHKLISEQMFPGDPHRITPYKIIGFAPLSGKYTEYVCT
jgi:hypothetical protein